MRKRAWNISLRCAGRDPRRVKSFKSRSQSPATASRCRGWRGLGDAGAPEASGAPRGLLEALDLDAVDHGDLLLGGGRGVVALPKWSG